MLTLVADANIEGQVKHLVRYIKQSEWGEIFALLDVTLRELSEFGLAHNSEDRVVWTTMQQHEAILITANRNEDGVDSLQATIDDQSCSALNSLASVIF